LTAGPFRAVAAEWEALQTAPAPPDPDQLAPLAARLYRDRMLRAPSRVVVVGSPLEGVLAAGPLSRVERSVHAAVADPPFFGALGAMRRVLDSRFFSVFDGWSFPAAARTMTHLQERVIVRQAGDAATAALRLPRDAGVQEPLPRAAAQWLLSQSRTSPSLELWLEFARVAGWWWAFERTLLVSAKPCTLALDRRHRLHAAGGPALAYPDGWAIHAHHGVVVPAMAVLAPERFDVRRVLTEGNVELRRALIELYGFERFVRDAGAMCLHAEGDRALYRVNLPGDEPLVLVKVTCPSTARAYFLRVPPTITRCGDAVAWTFGMDAAAYAPRAET
jgi:hypothetical protein